MHHTERKGKQVTNLQVLNFKAASKKKKKTMMRRKKENEERIKL